MKETAKGGGEEVALEQARVHDNKEKCEIQAYTRVTIQRMTGKKIFHNTDQKPKSDHRGQVREWASRN